MEQVTIELPGGGSVEALRIQDLPAEHIIAFMTMPPGLKEQMSIKLFQLAVGSAHADVLSGMTFGELEHVLSEWMFASAESESGDEDGRGSGLDWKGIIL